MDTQIVLNIRNGVYMDHTKTGYCFVCHIAITSEQVHSQHIEGKKHKGQVVAFFGPGEGTDNAGEGARGPGEGTARGPECREGCRDCRVVQTGLREAQEYLSAKHCSVQDNMSRSVEEKEAVKNQALTKTVQPEALMKKTGGCGSPEESLSATQLKTVVESRSSPQASPPVVSAELSGHCSPPGQFHGPQLKKIAPQAAVMSSLNAVVKNDLSCPHPGPAQGDSTPALPCPPQTAHTEGAPSGRGEEKMTNLLHVSQPALNIPPSSLDSNGSSEVCRSQGSISAATPPPEPNTKRCDACDMNFSGPQSAKDHYCSEAHKQKKHIAELVCSGALPRDTETGALRGKVGAADTDQYICDLCFVHTNSPVSYREHVNSKAHKIHKIE